MKSLSTVENTCEKKGTCDYIITHKVTRKRYYFFGPEITIVTNYRGDCSVWYEYPSGRRCGTIEEVWLNQVWQSHKWEEKDQRN